jgi:hypothetical protein
MIATSAPREITVQRLGGLPRLVIEDAAEMARYFFEHDASARPGGYDDWVARNDRDRFERHDVEIINGPMRARSPYEAWEPLFGRSPEWLTTLGAAWDLVDDSPEKWATNECARLLTRAIDATSVKRVGRAMATKVLHMKRPRLVPILDSLVVEAVGGSAGEEPTPTVVLVDQLRLVATANGASLSFIKKQLAGLPFQPSKARILDAILWTSHPQSSLHAHLGWPTRIAPPSARMPPEA